MNLLKRTSVLTIVLWTLTIICMVLTLKSSDEPVLGLFINTPIETIFGQFASGNSIIFNVSIGFLVSIIFYILVVWIPDKRRKNIIKHNIEEQYPFFKEDTIHILLSACSVGSYDSNSPSKLSDQNEFRKYFKENISASQNRWHAVFNGLEGYLLRELLVELEILLNEVTFVLNNVYINDQNVFSFFKRLSYSVYKLKNTTSEYDDLKRLASFLWELFAGWSMIDGYRNEEIVKVMISKI